MPTLCVILARAGSKGLLNKNVLEVGGQPMIAWTIAHAKAANCLDHIVVSTDGREIAQEASDRDVEVIDRPAELAGDTATVDSAARHAVEEAEKRYDVTYDTVVILYGNVPIRPDDLIDRAVAKLAATGCDSVQSVCPVGKIHPFWMKKLTLAPGAAPSPVPTQSGGRDNLGPPDSGGVRASSSPAAPDPDVLEYYQPNNIYRRQDLPPVYMLDGGIIAVTRKSLFTTAPGEPHAFLGRDRRAIITQPGEVVDVDNAADLELAQAAFAARGGDRLSAEAATASNRVSTAVIHIRDRAIGPSETPYVIAELGVNHDGSVERALELTRAAAQSGADAVKLQLFDPRLLLSAEATLAWYQRAAAADPFTMLDRLQLPARDIVAVRDLAHDLGLGFIVTCFSIELVPALRDLDPDAIKVASPDCVNLPLIEALVELGKPMLVSTGTYEPSDDPVFERMVRLCTAGTGGNLLLLACVSKYPVPDAACDLGWIAALADLYGLPVGYSDHTTNLYTGMMAVAHGACLLEKHLTYNRSAAGPDHAASFEPAQFKEYADLARLSFRLLGFTGRAEGDDDESDVRRVARQSLCALRDMAAGHILSREDVTVKRPGTGIPAARLDECIGKALRRRVLANHLLHKGDVDFSSDE